MTFGTFIQPDPRLAALADPNETLGIEVYSGYRAIDQAADLRGQNRIFDAIWQRWLDTPLACEDQCSAQYYFDVVRALRDMNGEFTRVVEVGVYMGGSTSILGGCIGPFDFDLDLVDIDPRFLRYAHERVRRMYPESAHRIRLFHGDLPAYVAAVMLNEAPARTIVHHDGAHDFNQVVRDMASLYYVQEQLVAIIAQDTHLRGSADQMNFVDMALYGVFGHDMSYAQIGSCHDEYSSLTHPNQYQGNYFRPGAFEGFVLPMEMNRFCYPHPSMPIEQFLSRPPIAAAA